ncbi:molecular chaperone DnaJ [Natronococcus pandeyae]|uniref:Molecular chaperone DnaJ n=1 Tax=Natronococcus pandeyae TaxID=2055836 RepID=A0A8J8Q5A1_9EURY|nr:DnaJ domain-containing protein [Natronococcus pandeyae]TYL38838.1 molecular chaperone DnaJ [Natronococcus pandeyae]
MTEDFYDLLEISSDASQDEIKDAYREQVRVYHPDHNDDSRARAQFTAIKKAYDILGDPVERKAYDRLGHETYVAKRTSGLPSPDVWRSDDSSDEDDEDDDADAEATATAGASAAGSSATGGSTTSTGSGSAAGSGAGSASGTTTSSGSTSSGSTSSGSTASSSSQTAGAAGAAGTAAGSTSKRRESRTSDGTDTEAARERTAGTTGATATSADSTADNAVVRWWRRQNFGLPLLWLSLVVYVAGLGQFASANTGALETLRNEVTAVGADPGELLAVLESGRYGLETTVGFVTGAELVAPPLEPIQWYGGLAGVVVATLAAVLVARFVREGDTWRSVTIDETIVVALAVGTTTALVGGPLLAGTVLLPLLFGVIVFKTRQGPGWTPTYLYVLPVLAPTAGFAAAMAGHATLVVDLVAFVLVPVVGALCLPIRATIRTRFGR